jgi:hypothetical protein
MAFDNIRKSLGLMPQEDIESLSTPSIMDQYIKQNDPEQYKKIQLAQMLKGAQESGPGMIGSMGSKLGNIAQEVAPLSKMEKWTKMMKEIEPNYTPELDTSFLDPHALDYADKYKEMIAKKAALSNK